jgi:hypothetical protein
LLAAWDGRAMWQWGGGGVMVAWGLSYSG